MTVPQNIHNYLKSIGQKGGLARAKKLSGAERVSQARRAVVSRWMKQRFGTDRFEKLGIPGWEIVDLGLRDLADGNHSSVAALAVAEVRPKLRFLGVPVPDVPIQNANIRMRLYRAMEDQHQDMAHARFSALLERVDSFCNTLASLTDIPQSPTHRNRRWYL